MASVCRGCLLTESDAASRFTRNNEETLSFLREHAVLPRAVKCPRCDKPCTLRAERHQWECYSKVRKPKSKKRIQCNFSVSDYKGTFLDKCHIDPWKLVLFVNFWLRKWFSHRQIFDNLQLNSQTAVTWRRYCSEVAEDFVAHQPPIGGPHVLVEIAEFEFVKSKSGRGREDAAGVWVFGGIERVSEKFFAVGFMEDPRRDRAALIPLILKHIRPGSIIVSEEWPDGMKLSDHGYRHLTIHHSTEFEVPPNPDIHTRNIERLWRDIKSFVLRSGIRREYYQQYISRYIFIKSVGSHSELLLHAFFIAAGKLYPHTTQPGPSSCSASSGIIRSKRWLANCKRGDLLNRDVDYLDHNGRPCAEHFSADQFMNTQEKKQCITIQAPKERFSTPPNEHDGDLMFGKNTRTQKPPKERVLAEDDSTPAFECDFVPEYDGIRTNKCQQLKCSTKPPVFPRMKKAYRQLRGAAGGSSPPFQVLQKEHSYSPTNSFEVHEKKIESESNGNVAMESVCNKEEVTKSSLEPLHIKEEIEFEESVTIKEELEFEESVTIKEEPIELEPEPDFSCIKEETQDYFSSDFSSSEVVVKEESRQDCFTSDFMDFCASGMQCEGDSEGVISTTDLRFKNAITRRSPRVPCACPNCIEGERGGKNKKKVHICHISGCNKQYGKTSHLRAHLRMHSGDRPFACSWLSCNKSFTRSDELSRHEWIHSREKKLHCPDCQKGFNRSDHLSKHVKTHNKQNRLNHLNAPHSSDSCNSSDAGEKILLITSDQSGEPLYISTDDVFTGSIRWQQQP